ncbi:unnamed protein product, partial [Rotaria magnacalcarata]
MGRKQNAISGIMCASFCLAQRDYLAYINHFNMEDMTLNLPIREIRPRSYTIGNDSDVKHLQKQVEITVDIMHKNIQLGLNRAENLDDLEKRSSKMEEETNHMAHINRRLHRNYCWKNAQTWIIAISVVTIIIGIIM